MPNTSTGRRRAIIRSVIPLLASFCLGLNQYVMAFPVSAEDDDLSKQQSEITVGKALLSSQSGSNFSDNNWTSLGIDPSPIQNVNSIVVDHNRKLVYVGGRFTSMGTVLANNIAVWNGKEWSALGGGLNGTVNALALDKAGNLFVGGLFSDAGGMAANFIACWNGHTWESLGSGLNREVEALAIGTNGNLYAGGRFTSAGSANAYHIALWKNNAWFPLGSGVGTGVLPFASRQSVNAIVFDKTGNLYAGGAYTNAGNITANNIAKWDGNNWSALGTGVSEMVSSLANDSMGNVYAGGFFTNAGLVAANYIARWNGSAWAAMGVGLNGNVSALVIDGSGNIYAGGPFGPYGSLNQSNVVSWNGTNWMTLPSGMNGSVQSLALDASGILYVGGTFTTIGNINALNIARWEYHSWSALLPKNAKLLGLNSAVNALALDRAGDVYIGGNFTSAGGSEANFIVEWDGKTWIPLGAGLDGPVNSLAFDHATNLYVGGSFTHAGGILASNIAKWDGHNWSALNSGFNGPVSTMVVDHANHLYVAGSFTVAGGQTANYVAGWNGSQWSQVGGGLDNGVNALAIDSHDNIYAGGFLPVLSYYFGAPFGYTHVAEWSGGSWNALPAVGHISSLAVDPMDNLYAGGNDVMAELISSGWTNLGSGLVGIACPDCSPNVNTLVFDTAGNLYAGGSFTSSGDLLVDCVATWNGSQWSALGSGVDDPVNSLALDKTGHLYVGGAFTTAGNKASSYIASATVGPRLEILNQSASDFFANQGSVDFGATNILSSTYGTLYLRNIFDGELIVSGITIVATNSEDFTINDFYQWIDPDKPVVLLDHQVFGLNLKFTPKAAGQRYGTLIVSNNGTFDNPFILHLTGSGELIAKSVATSSTNNKIVCLPDGNVDIQLCGYPGTKYVVQCSTDLERWYNFSTNICGSDGTWQIIKNGNENQCFFRIVTP